MMRSKMKRLVGGALAGAAAVSGSVFAQTTGSSGADFSQILAGIAVAGAVSAIVGAGAIYAGPGFAKWATKKVAGFFG